MRDILIDIPAFIEGIDLSEERDIRGENHIGGQLHHVRLSRSFTNNQNRTTRISFYHTSSTFDSFPITSEKATQLSSSSHVWTTQNLAEKENVRVYWASFIGSYTPVRRCNELRGPRAVSSVQLRHSDWSLSDWHGLHLSECPLNNHFLLGRGKARPCCADRDLRTITLCRFKTWLIIEQTADDHICIRYSFSRRLRQHGTGIHETLKGKAALLLHRSLWEDGYTSAFDAVRLQTTSEKPFFRMFFATALPIPPRPRNVTFNVGDAMSTI